METRIDLGTPRAALAQRRDEPGAGRDPVGRGDRGLRVRGPDAARPDRGRGAPGRRALGAQRRRELVRPAARPDESRRAGDDGGLALRQRADRVLRSRDRAGDGRGARTERPLSAPTPLSPELTGFLPLAADLSVAADDEGNGVVTAGEPRGEPSFAPYDGAGPRVTASFPAGGVIRQPLPFAATALDVWSGAAFRWEFGDVTAAFGSDVSHGYQEVGAYTATVTAVDKLGNASTRSGDVAIGALPDTIAPRFRGRASLKPKRVRKGDAASCASRCPSGHRARDGDHEASWRAARQTLRRAETTRGGRHRSRRALQAHAAANAALEALRPGRRPKAGVVDEAPRTRALHAPADGTGRSRQSLQSRGGDVIVLPRRG